MNYSEFPYNSLELALIIAQDGHAKQVDKQGKSYLDHVMAVVEDCHTTDEKIVAALHDLVEDTDFTLDDLRPYFKENIIEAVDAITHREGEARIDYLGRVKTNEIAINVKKADVLNNISRLPGLKGTPDYDRLAHKYLETIIAIYT